MGELAIRNTLPPKQKKPALSRARKKLRHFMFASPVYSFMLSGPAPHDLFRVVENIWPGDATKGARILRNIFNLLGQDMDLGTDPWKKNNLGAHRQKEMHSFIWLRDLMEVGGTHAQEKSRLLIEDWIKHHADWHPFAWRVDILGERLSAWITCYEFFATNAPPKFLNKFFKSLSRQARHLVRLLERPDHGSARIKALKGLIYVQHCMQLPKAPRTNAASLLEMELRRQILPDGGHIERSPQTHLDVLADLVEIRHVLDQSQKKIPDILQHAIENMAVVTRTWCHPDGKLSLFHSSNENTKNHIDAILNAATTSRKKTRTSLPDTGYEKMQSGKTSLIMDVGTPAPEGDKNFAGCLSFEMSIGKQRMIVNCGHYDNDHPTWRDVQRTTAAHSTLTLHNTSSVDITEDGEVLSGITQTTVDRTEQDGNILVAASHDGYMENFGIMHHRNIFMAPEGEDIRGEDRLEGRTATDFCIRFHLHPEINALMAQSGQAVLLFPPNGNGWICRASGGDKMELSESIYLGVAGQIKRTQQIVISGTTRPGTTTIKWAIRRDT